jgi:CTP:molybdopterin cytidylyltransferase MocA
MGGRKARLLVGGQTLSALHLSRLTEVGCTSVRVVVHPEDEDLVPNAIVSTADEQSGSLRVALASIPSNDSLVIVTPVDVLPAAVATIQSLVHVLDAPDALAATPSFRGLGGHPIVVRRKILDTLTRGGTLRDPLADLGPHRHRMEVDDPNVTSDLDDPAAAIHWLGSSPQFLRRRD